MIDSHTHITDEAFAADREAVLRRAKSAGVDAIAVVGQDPDENLAVLAAVGAGGGWRPAPSAVDGAETPVLLPFLGLHPDRFADRHPSMDPSMVEAVLEQIRRHAGDIAGIGEVGLDYWVCQDEARRAAQREALKSLAALAREKHLALNVHSRSAGRHTLDLLLEQGNERVLMHAFDGKAGHALRGAEAGYVFSIPPSIVRSPQKQKLVRLLPLTALALETDSPVLGPVAGERNEPANLTLAAAAIAAIKGVPEAEVRAACTANAERVFGWPTP